MTQSKALIFDIKRFAIHDGNGLRTTVFLKGCPLKCQWCQNPEGISFKRQPLFIASECISCRRCAAQARPGQMIFKGGRPYLDYDYPGDFDNLIDACPALALRYDSEEYDVAKLMETIKQDQVFFKYGGGVTFSGGEPLAQPDFLKSVLEKCSHENIHTALETSLHAPFQVIEEIIPLVDQIYVDLKIFDDDEHLKYTGVSSQLIKTNIQKLLCGPYQERVTIRTPLIPDITAISSNLATISRFLISLDPQVKYELLNYNYLAGAKYDRLDRQYPLDSKLQRFTKAQMEQFYEILSLNGIINIIK